MARPTRTRRAFFGGVLISTDLRFCARVGCQEHVKKPTNKYCSRACCAVDPERKQRLREASIKRVLPMQRQLDLDVWGSEESAIEAACRELEEAPAGLSRLAG